MEPPAPGGFLGQTTEFAAIGAASGAVLGMLQGAWGSPPKEIAFTHTGRLVASHSATLGAVAAVFGGTEAIVSSVRGPSVFNSVIAGCAAGSVMGARNGSLPTAAAGCGLFGGVQFLAQFGLSTETPLKVVPSSKPDVPTLEPANKNNGGAFGPDALPVRKPQFFS